MNVVVYKINTRALKFSNWCYIIEDLNSSSAIIIDPSWDFNVFQKMIDEHNIKVEAVFLTHSHFDHTNLVNRFVNKYNAQVFMSREEKEYYGIKFRNLHLLNNNQSINFNGIEVDCFLTPGHTKGSMCFLIDGKLFTGDTVFNEGCGWCSGNGGSPEDMYYSMMFIKNNIPWDTIIYPSHIYGKPVGQTLGYIMDYNIYFNFNNIDDFVKFRTRKGQKKLFDFI